MEFVVLIILAIVAIAFVCLIFALLYSMFTKKGAPKSTPKGDVFFSKLTDSFGYRYFYDKTGYSIDMKNKLISLYNKGRHKTYNLSELRSIEYSWNQAEIIKIIGGDPGFFEKLKVSNLNSDNARAAYESSGIFINAVDVDMPRWQIKVANESDLFKSLEIIQQALHGKLAFEKCTP
ncbi:hypothetical protein JCM15519_22450 [Fundidesulfovibrio butyratiphilus]